MSRPKTGHIEPRMRQAGVAIMDFDDAVAWEGGVRCLCAWQYPTLHYGNRAVVALPLSVPGRGVSGGAGSPLYIVGGCCRVSAW